MTYSKIPLAQTLSELCKQHSFRHIIISPGSRNAPLTISFTHDPFFKCYSIVDERCAAFFALGIAQQTKEPSVLVCTSGSALLNYYPAVAEAFYSNIPLIVISADRPKHLLNIGDGQTINQRDVFANHIVASVNLKPDIDPENNENEKDELPIFKNLENRLEKFLGIQKGIQNFNESEINKALNEAVNKFGPVHINAPFNEPLYETTDQLVVKPIKHISYKENILPTPADFGIMLDQWNKASKKMILVGVLYPGSIESKYLNILSRDESVLIFTETTSNLPGETILQNIDKLIAPLNKDELEALRPEILITFGGMVVSKKIKAFLRNFQPKEHWHIGEHKANDTFYKLNRIIRTDVNTFLSRFLPEIEKVSSSYKSIWLEVNQKRKLKHREYLNGLEFSDLKAFEVVIDTLPEKSIVHFSNSTAIRYSQLFDIKNSIEVYSNRGTSGIDGSTSTAVGCAVVRNKQTILITGDLSFLYDSNGLWNDAIPNNFRIIILNNSGGGIFRILPKSTTPKHFEEFFETTHALTAEHLANMYNLEYRSCDEIDNLTNEINDFYNESNKPRILEIFTPRLNNAQILLNYFEAIS